MANNLNFLRHRASLLAKNFGVGFIDWLGRMDIMAQLLYSAKSLIVKSVERQGWTGQAQFSLTLNSRSGSTVTARSYYL